nr:MAG TPA: hypothetical protein [Caudoviricetes sp.]
MYHAIQSASLCSCIKFYTNKQQEARIKKKHIYTKKRKNRLLPCYQWLKGLPVMAFVVTKHIS